MTLLNYSIIQDTLTNYISNATNYTATFPAAQVALKVVEAGLDMVEDLLGKVVTSPESVVVSSVRKVHTTANNIRVSGLSKVGTEEAKKTEENSEDEVKTAEEFEDDGSESDSSYRTKIILL